MNLIQHMTANRLNARSQLAMPVRNDGRSGGGVAWFGNALQFGSSSAPGGAR